MSRFMEQLIPGIPYPFHGVIRITSNTPIAVIGLRGDYNSRGDFIITTPMPTDENATPISARLIFPHLADGGGYSSEFVIYSGTATEAGGGTLQFFQQSGQSLPLILNLTGS